MARQSLQFQWRSWRCYHWVGCGSSLYTPSRGSLIWTEAPTSSPRWAYATRQGSYLPASWSQRSSDWPLRKCHLHQCSILHFLAFERRVWYFWSRHSCCSWALGCCQSPSARLLIRWWRYLPCYRYSKPDSFSNCCSSRRWPRPPLDLHLHASWSPYYWLARHLHCSEPQHCSSPISLLQLQYPECFLLTRVWPFRLGPCWYSTLRPISCFHLDDSDYHMVRYYCLLMVKWIFRFLVRYCLTVFVPHSGICWQRCYMCSLISHTLWSWHGCNRYRSNRLPSGQDC